MFVKSTVKASGLWNALILIVIVFVVTIVALALVKVVPDPKNAGTFRHSFGFGKKKTGTA